MHDKEISYYSRNKYPKSLVLWGLFFVIDLLISMIIGSSVYFDLVVALGYILFLYKYIKAIPFLLYRHLFLLVSILGTLLGTFICENCDLWLLEVQVSAHRVGIFSLVTFISYLMFSLVLMLERIYPIRDYDNIKKLAVKINGEKLSVSNIIIYLVIAVEFLMLYQIFSHPFWNAGIDRISYYNEYFSGTNSLYKNLLGFLKFAMIVPIISYLNLKTKKALVAILLGIVCMFGVGEKFGPYIFYATIAGIVFSIKGEYIPIQKLKKYFKYLIAIGLTFMCLLFTHMSLGSNIYNFDPAIYLEQRFAQQGQLFWRTYDLSKNQDMHIDELPDEINVFFSLDNPEQTDINHGIRKIMMYTISGDSSIFWRYFDKGAVYSNSTLSSFYYYFKEFGILLYIIITVVVYWSLVRLVIFSIKHDYTIESILSVKLLSIWFNVMFSSSFFEITSPKTVMICMIILSCQYVRKRNNRINYGKTNVLSQN